MKKTLKNIFWIFMAILLISSGWEKGKTFSTNIKQILIVWVSMRIMFFVLKCFTVSAIKGHRKFLGSVQSTVTPVVYSFFSSGNSSSYGASGAYDKGQQAKQQAWNRYQARQEAAFHDYRARQTAGTSEGYWHQNQANAARERARR